MTMPANGPQNNFTPKMAPFEIIIHKPIHQADQNESQIEKLPIFCNRAVFGDAL